MIETVRGGGYRFRASKSASGLRLRLTLWFVFGVVLVTVAGAVGTYAILGQQLRSEVDSKLIQQLNHYQQVVARRQTSSLWPLPPRTTLPGPQSSSLRQGAYIFSLQTSDGTVVSNSSEVRLEDLPATRALLESGEPYLLDVSAGGQSYRVAGTPVLLAESRWARSRSPVRSRVSATRSGACSCCWRRGRPRLPGGGTGLVALGGKSPGPRPTDHEDRRRHLP